MKNLSRRVKRIRDQKGVTIILVVVLLTGFLALAALAVDVGHLIIVRNELQNAADAGALAGAQFLHLEDGTVNPNANQAAYDTATLNRSDKATVNVNWTGGNTGDIQRGHWCFATRTFTPNDSLDATDLWNVTAEELDADLDFINAVRVQARRESPAAASFFARIFGIENFTLNAEAVAYVGFAGTLQPGDVDQPIAICRQSILGWGSSEDEYTCQFGRMINSGQNSETHQTGGWTNFTQPCQTASTNTVRPLVCGDGNPDPLQMGQGMGTTGGELQNAFDRFRTCWTNGSSDWDDDGELELIDTDGNGWPDQPWSLTLPVVDCPGNNTGNCATLMGAVTINVIWVTRNDKNNYNEVPRNMADWSCPSGSTGQQCWESFRDHFNLRDISTNAPLTYEDKTIYFMPDCTPHEPMGNTGGHNSGILAKYPKLVNPVISQ